VWNVARSWIDGIACLDKDSSGSIIVFITDVDHDPIWNMAKIVPIAPIKHALLLPFDTGWTSDS
jgi:hypothetical protein